jgi:hypothetical protein
LTDKMSPSTDYDFDPDKLFFPNPLTLLTLRKKGYLSWLV